MLLIMTPTGNSGRHVLSSALAAGAPVRVLVRNASKLTSETRARCEVVEGDLRDPEALGRAAHGVDAAFFCIPLQSSEPVAVAEYHRSFFAPAARAFAQAGVARVVTISGGRGVPTDRGPNGPLAQMEQAFAASAQATRHVRCGYFMENFLHITPLLKFMGKFSLPIEEERRLALESACDIGQEAARWLLDPSWTGHEGVIVPRGEVLSAGEIASVMSRVLGRKIAYLPTTSEAYEAMLVKRGGLSGPMARSIRELFEDMHHGTLDGASARKSNGVPFEQWATAKLVPAMKLGAVLRRVFH